jgi:DNA-binding beta-propeller fold protein YncE
MVTPGLMQRAAAAVPVVAFVLASAPAVAATAATRPASVIKVGARPGAIGIDTANGTAWVISGADGNVAEIADGRVVATIPVDAVNPADVAVDSRTGTVWVADGSTGAVTEISAADGQVLQTIMLTQADAFPSAIAVDPAHGEVFVTESTPGNLVEFSESDPTSQQVVAAGDVPLALAVDPLARTVWVTDQDDTAAEFSYSSALKSVATLPLGDEAVAIAIDPAAGLVFLPQFNDGTVMIVNLAGRTLHTVKVGDQPASVAVDPLHGDVWVSNFGSDYISQIAESSGKVTASYPLGYTPGSLAVQPGAGVYVSNFLGGSVTFLQSVLRLKAPRSAAFRAGRRGSVDVTATGFPAASISLSGRLPAGLHWSASGPHGRIAGTPKRGTEGTYHLILRAGTSWGRHVSKRLTIKVS